MKSSSSLADVRGSEVRTSGKRIRVLQVVDGLDRGGIESWLVRLLPHLERDAVAMDFLVTADRPFAYAKEIEARGARIIPCLDRPVSSYFSGPLSVVGNRWVWHYARRLERALRELGPYDIVHSHFDPCGFPLLCARRAGVHVRIAHSHMTYPELLYRGRLVRTALAPLARRWIQKAATLGLAVSRAAARAMFGAGWVRDPRWRVLHPGIDLEPFRQPVDRAAVRAALGIPTDALVVGHVGRLEEVKNHAFLIDLVAALAPVEPRLRLLLLGEGRLRSEIEQRAERAGLTGRVLFLGARPDVPRILLGAMDVFVFPSVHEGLGLAGVEAQAAGLPCLVSDAVPDEMDVVPPLVRRMSLERPAADWAAAVAELAARPRPLSQAEALARVEQGDFNVRHTVVQLQQLYRACLPA
jgi:glycosyltransferase involved in cell wall biosynthesis